MRICVYNCVRKCIYISQTFLGDRYGFQPIPVEMDAEEFELLFDEAIKSDVVNRELLKEWYRKDDNAVPPIYALQVLLK